MKSTKLRVATLVAVTGALLASLSLFPIEAAPPQKIQVVAANPDYGEQGTVSLDVDVSGSGFEPGATTEFVNSDTGKAGGIQVNSTNFVAADKVRANITIATDADLADFDILVRVNGRRGKGTALFAVIAAGGTPVRVNGTSPNVGEQGSSSLAVSISGQRFEPGATVRFLRNGTPIDTDISVVGTTFVDERELLASLDIDPAAFVGSYDVEVVVGPDVGIGTNVFSVVEPGSRVITNEQIRVTFGDDFSADPGGLNQPGFGPHRFGSDTWSDASLLCSALDTPWAQYWTALGFSDLVDLACQGTKPLAAMNPSLTGSVGFMFEAQSRMTDVYLLSAPVPPNRWFVADLSQAIPGSACTSPPCGCPDIDTADYDPTDPELGGYFPPVTPGCVDNLEGRLVFGTNIFDYSVGDVIPGPNFQIRIPEIREQKGGKNKERYVAHAPRYLLTWDSWVVTQAGDPDRVTVACGVSGHDCRARLTLGSEPKVQEEMGSFVVPLELTVERVLCDDEGNCAVP